MKNCIGLGLAIAATTSLAIAGGGEGDKKKAKKVTNSKTLEAMASTQGGGGAMLKAAPGSGLTITAGDDFSLKLKNRVQVLWRYSDFENAADMNNFSIRRARTALSGHVWDDTKTYKVQLDWARDGVGDILLDAWFNWDFWSSESGNNAVGLRVGQQKPHHGREFQGSSAYLEHTQRSLASRTFTGTRVTGAFLHGTHVEGDKLNWWAGVANGDPAAASAALETVGGNGSANPDNEINFFANVSFDPWGDFGDESFQQGDLDQSEEFAGTFGAGVLVGNHRTAATAPDVETVSFNGYFGMKFKGVHALVEGFLRSDDPDVAGSVESDSVGAAAGASYTLRPREEGGSQWSFAGRWSIVQMDDNNGAPLTPVLLTGSPLAATSGDVNELEATVSNYYHKHKMKTQVGYRYQQVDFDGATVDADNHFIDIMFQWMF